MNNNRGVSLVALIVMMIVMIIIAGIAISSGTGSYEKALEAKNREEQRQMINAVSSRFGDYQRNKSLKPLLGDKIPDELLDESLNESVRIAQIKNYLITMFRSEGKLATQDELDNKTIENGLQKFLESNINDMEYTRVLRHSQVIELGIESANLNSEFVVNYYSADVVGPIQ